MNARLQAIMVAVPITVWTQWAATDASVMQAGPSHPIRGTVLVYTHFYV